MPLELAQFIAYVTLTVTGIIVAIVSLRFSFRQNFGWKPIIMVTSQGLKSGFLDEAYVATLKLEFWNRRKYPLIVRHITLTFSDMKFLANRAKQTRETGWHIQYSGGGIYMNDFTVDGSGHQCVEFEAPFAKRPLDNLRSDVNIQVMFFDPRLNENVIEKIEYVYELNPSVGLPEE